MTQEPTIDDDPRPIFWRSGMRGLGDLLFVVVATAFMVLILALLVRADLDDAHRIAFGLVTLLLLVSHAARWWLLALRNPPDPASRLGASKEVASGALALVVLVCLLALGAIDPSATALDVLALVASAAYLSTWE